MSYGTATIIFNHLVKTGVPDELGNYVEVPTSTPAPGCRHRPLAFKEIVELNLDIATEYWRSTLPLEDYDGTLIAVIKATKPQDTVTVEGQDYQIVAGVRPHDDFEGVPFKATIISQKQTG